MKVSYLFIILCSVVFAPEGMESTFRFTLIFFLVWAVHGVWKILREILNKTSIFFKVVKLLETMTKSRSRSRSKSRDRTRRSKHRKRSRSQSRSRKTEKQHSSRVTSSRKDVSETKYRFTVYFSLNVSIPHILIFVFRKGRSRSSSSSNSDSDGTSRRHRHSRSSKLSEVERLAEMERQRAAQNARLM